MLYMVVPELLLKALKFPAPLNEPKLNVPETSVLPPLITQSRTALEAAGVLRRDTALLGFMVIVPLVIKLVPYINIELAPPPHEPPKIKLPAPLTFPK